ncbi:MAG: hypothetical protein V3U84_12485 [Thiotrichaceae bacterium]
MKQLTAARSITFESIAMRLIECLENILNSIHQQWITQRQEIRMSRRKKKWLKKLG